jgi:plasmid stabilization system protein ParE
MLRVVVTHLAEQDIQAAHDWWAEHRSAEQAARWYRGINAAIKTLERSPDRCSVATEEDLLAQGVRQFLYGLGRKRTHRIVFAIDGDEVIVFRVRHTSQAALSPEDLL